MRNVSWNFAGQLWSFGVTILATPFIVHGLGEDGYGVLATLGVVTNYVWFMDLGLGQATVKYVAEYAARAEWAQVRRVYWTSAAGYLLLGGLAALVVGAVAPLCVYHWFQIPPALQPDALRAFYLAAVGVLFGLLNYGPLSLLRGLERFDLVNKLNMAVGTAQPLLTVILLQLGFHLPAVIGGGVVLTALSFVVNWILAVRHLPLLGRPTWDGATFKRMLHFGSFLTGSSLIVPLLVSFEKLMLANQVSIAAVSYYMVPHSFASRLAVIPSSFSNALFPRFSGIHGSTRAEEGAELNFRVNRAILLIFFPPTLVLLLFGKEFLDLWMGATFAQHAAGALTILLLATFIHSLAWTPHMLVPALGRPDVTLKIYIAEAVVSLPITYFAVRAWGVEGAAFAWLFRVTVDTALVWIGVSRVTGTSLGLMRILSDSATLAMVVGGGCLWIGRGIFLGSADIGQGTLALTGLIVLAIGLTRPMAELFRQVLESQASTPYAPEADAPRSHPSGGNVPDSDPGLGHSVPPSVRL